MAAGSEPWCCVHAVLPLAQLGVRGDSRCRSETLRAKRQQTHFVLYCVSNELICLLKATGPLFEDNVVRRTHMGATVLIKDRTCNVNGRCLGKTGDMARETDASITLETWPLSINRGHSQSEAGKCSSTACPAFASARHATRRRRALQMGDGCRLKSCRWRVWPRSFQQG